MAGFGGNTTPIVFRRQRAIRGAASFAAVAVRGVRSAASWQVAARGKCCTHQTGLDLDHLDFDISW